MSSDKPICLVTGAAGTLGTEFCRRYATRYDIVAVWYRRPPVVASQEQSLVDPLDTGADLPENEAPVFAVRADIRKERQVERVVSQVLDAFGRVDIVVNMAVRSVWAPMLDNRRLLDTFGEAFRVNVGSPLILATTLATRCWAVQQPEQNRAANRNIVNLSSTAGLDVNLGYGQSLYSATKAALNLLSCHMAAELAPIGVRVNALAPDSFPQPITLDTVLGGLDQLIQGDMSGQILVQQSEGQTWL